MQMENNVIKENYLEVLPNNKLISKYEKNKLPLIKDNKELLPVVVDKRELALIEIKKEFSEVKKNKSIIGVLKFLKKALILFAKFIRWSILTSSKIVAFAVVSAIIVISTTIITKNIVNSKYSTDFSKDKSTYSIFKIKEEFNK